MNFIAFRANKNEAWRFRTCSITFHHHQFVFSFNMETKEQERKKNRIYNSKMIWFCNTALFTPLLLLCNLVKREFQGNRPLHLASFQSNFQFITIIYAMSWCFSIKYLLIMWHMLINRARSRSLFLSHIASSLLWFYQFSFAQSCSQSSSSVPLNSHFVEIWVCLYFNCFDNFHSNSN